MAVTVQCVRALCLHTCLLLYWCAHFCVAPCHDSNAFQAAGSTCVAPLTDLQRLATGFFVPLVGTGFLALNCALHYLFWHLARTDRLCAVCTTQPWLKSVVDSLKQKATFMRVIRRYRRTILAFAATSFASFAQATFTFFACTEVNGESFLKAYPSVSCTQNSEYLMLRPLFILLLIIVVLMPVALYVRLRYLNHYGLLYGDPEIQFV
jgi:hypothetical protein